MKVKKKINLDLIGVDGNAFVVMAAFRMRARREGWSDEEIKTVTDEATEGDYNHFLSTIMSYCED